MNKRTQRGRLKVLGKKFAALEKKRSKIDAELERVAKKMRILEERPLSG